MQAACEAKAMMTRRPVRGKREADRAGLPTLPSPPRPIRLSATGAVILMACAASIGGSLFGAVALFERARISARQASQFASDAVATEARVVSVERRGSGGDRRTVVHYEYTVVGQRFRDSSELRRRDRDAYVVGAPIDIRYLAPEPSASWLEGRSPQRFPFWPAYVIPSAALLGVMAVLAMIQRQRHLLEHGRTAVATITHIDKKKSDKGTYWRVEYRWRLLSGATRTARYNHGSKHPPAIGTTLPIIYDRDNPQRQHKYPLPLVRLRRG